MTPGRSAGPPSPDPMPVIATGVRLPWDDVVEDPVADTGGRPVTPG